VGSRVSSLVCSDCNILATVGVSSCIRENSLDQHVQQLRHDTNFLQGGRLLGRIHEALERILNKQHLGPPLFREPCILWHNNQLSASLCNIFQYYKNSPRTRLKSERLFNQSSYSPILVPWPVTSPWNSNVAFMEEAVSQKASRSPITEDPFFQTDVLMLVRDHHFSGHPHLLFNPILP
jgi:hypothetical protein